MKWLEDRDRLRIKLFGFELKEPKSAKQRGDWVTKCAMMGLPVETIKVDKKNVND